MPLPTVSVVVAVWKDTRGLSACLAALAAQREQALEVLMPASAARPADLPPWVRWLPVEHAALVPELWSAGLSAARGEVVALTTAHFAPGPEWLARIRAAHARLDAAGIGGAIDPPGRGASRVAWATWFQRYAGSLGRAQEHEVSDLAADNAAYRRADLQAHAAARPDGFWEPEFHRRVLAAGGRLVFVPAIRVAMTCSSGLLRFCGQRLRHGRRYGRDRVARRGPARRLLRLVLAPLVPFVLLARTSRRTWRSPEHLTVFLASLPVLVLFVLCWCLGEAIGTLSPAPSDDSATGTVP